MEKPFDFTLIKIETKTPSFETLSLIPNHLINEDNAALPAQ